MKKNKGFSLIELLMVIAIIGILSTIILNSLSQSRAKAYDSKVKQQLNSFRTAAEMYFQNNSNSYGTYANCNAGGPTAFFRNIQTVNGQPGIYIDSANLPDNADRACESDGDSYAVKVSLYSGIDYWCVDSKGSSRVINDGSPATFCP